MPIREDLLSFEAANMPFSMEFARRTGRFTMPAEHFHEPYEMYYLLSGERYYFIRDRTYQIRSGDLVLIPANELHKTSEATYPEHERIVIYFEDSFLRQACPDHADFLLQAFRGNSPIYRFSPKEQLQAENLVGTLLKELQDRPPGYDLRLKHTALDLLLLAARQPERKKEAPPPLDSPLHQKISDIARHIEAHLPEDLSLSALAERFFISPYYLSRTFKEVTGFTLTEYVQTVRIRQAQRLLKETRLPVTEISSTVGFENFSHFGKVFKRITSRSPRQYRME